MILSSRDGIGAALTIPLGGLGCFSASSISDNGSLSLCSR